ncbi:Uncharacterized protein pbN1_39420 [Aromatoleum bremense]|nr:Uncharacterized protein pbN1_39420 [Aromatoleum bremense]
MGKTGRSGLAFRCRCRQEKEKLKRSQVAKTKENAADRDVASRE